MQRGDIYFVSLNPTRGHEQQGMRPVLIVSPDAFNLAMGAPLVAPITNGGGFARSRGFTVSLAEAGTTTTGVVLCSQMRTLDIEARHGRWVEQVPQHIMEDVLARLATLLS
ncbi:MULTISPECIES: type II toxin-antitoxin system PemK/MazF family toxin [Larsenimonas]|uniref:mRNA interferase n=1 Tax=Larsenimonas rhizosphaerae TaxID=2944682 RepID=A0AA41ZJ54_9GAMM|nr:MULTISPECIES: type II toxin-antitoxin system PemK/MazF family toxin [Larsenimonas]MCM5705824.1 type II toxin-antitoxin system PemK/MazF family toxin [Larsenimonas salina]MCX2525580.1 type II toxin-antitoxin system PemK/MazF family toxin [Larsenimonas rhizosphaerae]